MPYKDIDKKRKNARDRMRKWRANPINKYKQDKRRKFLRDNFEKTKKWEQQYYKNNRDKIIKRTKKYNSEHPFVRRKAQQKVNFTGAGKLRGKKDRKLLKPFYLKAQIRKAGAKKNVEIKKTEILIYRLKKKINDTRKNTKRPLV